MFDMIVQIRNDKFEKYLELNNNMHTTEQNLISKDKAVFRRKSNI